MKLRGILLGAASVALLALTVYAAEEVKLEGIKCIVSGKPAKNIDGSSVDHNGGKVYFCCPGCPNAFKKDTAKFAAKANHQLVATKQAKQEKCPLTGRALNDEQTVKVGGVEVTLCCGGCKGKVSKAEGDAQVALVFSDKAFKKGFKVAKKEE